MSWSASLDKVKSAIGLDGRHTVEDVVGEICDARQMLQDLAISLGYDGDQVGVDGSLVSDIEFVRQLIMPLQRERVRDVGSILIVPAPGDMCGNTKQLPDGAKCPGCRACS